MVLVTNGLGHMIHDHQLIHLRARGLMRLLTTILDACRKFTYKQSYACIQACCKMKCIHVYVDDPQTAELIP
jgi:hypothetical protein